MTKLTLEKDIILKRLEGIEAEIVELENLAKLDFAEFSEGNSWKLAQFHLHRALEGVFNIGSHIASRIPGSQATQYKEIAAKLGETGIVPKDFAETKLVQMAKYRNRLVHFYAQVTKEELYKILRDDLADIEMFLANIKKLLNNPAKFNLELE